ncbi:MAG: lecithin retinol acyltransferase family protein [Gemmataceae bacterium]|nr:lecithin retinol acyltransferase family protein [Gemmataceae bacterium]
MAKGDHILVPKGPITHHGIDLGDGTVVHWHSGWSGSIGANEIRGTPLDDEHFGDLSKLRVRQYGDCFNPDTVVTRAMRSVGKKGYCPIFRNCEHLASWCKTGHHTSKQVRDVAVTGWQAVDTAATTTNVMADISSSGPVAGLSAEGTVEGLKAIGSAVGGGPATGLVLVIALPPAAAAVGANIAYADDPTAPKAEREACAAARTAAVVAAPLGVAVSACAVAAAGVPGLSAVGISTGLAALGGGSVAVGLAAVSAFPPLAVIGISWLCYRVWGGGRRDAPRPTPSWARVCQ